jgi:hypothetical protein
MCKGSEFVTDYASKMLKNVSLKKKNRIRMRKYKEVMLRNAEKSAEQKNYVIFAEILLIT